MAGQAGHYVIAYLDLISLTYENQLINYLLFEFVQKRACIVRH